MSTQRDTQLSKSERIILWGYAIGMSILVVLVLAFITMKEWEIIKFRGWL